MHVYVIRKIHAYYTACIWCHICKRQSGITKINAYWMSLVKIFIDTINSRLKVSDPQKNSQSCCNSSYETIVQLNLEKKKEKNYRLSKDSKVDPFSLQAQSLFVTTFTCAHMECWVGTITTGFEWLQLLPMICKPFIILVSSGIEVAARVEYMYGISIILGRTVLSYQVLALQSLLWQLFVPPSLMNSAVLLSGYLDILMHTYKNVSYILCACVYSGFQFLLVTGTS